jgi:hypothetical protein
MSILAIRRALVKDPTKDCVLLAAGLTRPADESAGV